MKETIRPLPEPREGMPIRSGFEPRPLPEPDVGQPIQPETDTVSRALEALIVLVVGLCCLGLILVALLLTM